MKIARSLPIALILVLCTAVPAGAATSSCVKAGEKSVRENGGGVFTAKRVKNPWGQKPSAERFVVCSKNHRKRFALGTYGWNGDGFDHLNPIGVTGNWAAFHLSNSGNVGSTTTYRVVLIDLATGVQRFGPGAPIQGRADGFDLNEFGSVSYNVLSRGSGPPFEIGSGEVWLLSPDGAKVIARADDLFAAFTSIDHNRVVSWSRGVGRADLSRFSFPKTRRDVTKRCRRSGDMVDHWDGTFYVARREAGRLYERTIACSKYFGRRVSLGVERQSSSTMWPIESTDRFVARGLREGNTGVYVTVFDLKTGSVFSRSLVATNGGHVRTLKLEADGTVAWIARTGEGFDEAAVHDRAGRRTLIKSSTLAPYLEIAGNEVVFTNGMTTTKTL